MFTFWYGSDEDRKGNTLLLNSFILGNKGAIIIIIIIIIIVVSVLAL